MNEKINFKKIKILGERNVDLLLDFESTRLVNGDSCEYEEKLEVQLSTDKSSLLRIFKDYWSETNKLNLLDNYSNDFDKFISSGKVLGFDFDDLISDIMIQMHTYLINLHKYSAIEIVSTLNDFLSFVLLEETLKFIWEKICFSIKDDDTIIEYADYIFDDSFYDEIYSKYLLWSDENVR